MSTDEGIIRVRFANIYKYPIISGNIVARVVKGTRIQLLDEDEEFFKIAYSNQIAYVCKECVGASHRMTT